MPQPIHAAASQDGVTVKAYRGDGAVLLAFDLDKHLTANFAGFAIKRTPPGGKGEFLPNRLSFSGKQQITSDTTPEQRIWTPSNEAPFQKFRWVDFPSDLLDGEYTFEVTAMYRQQGGGLKAGPTAAVSLGILSHDFTRFAMGFTRGYLSSQAYATRFKNADYRPKQKSITYDTKPYAKQYEWLGFHARKLVFDFLQESIDDPSIRLDLFAYDLDEPDFINGLTQLKGRLRAFLDDAALHTKPGASEIDAKQALTTSAGEQNIKTGHFGRFAHCKVMIQSKGGVPVKVLTGSANFSVRGLYVQANNVLVFNDPETARLYEEAFEQAFDNMQGFKDSAIAQKWFDIAAQGLPPFSVCFSPHTSADISLRKVADAIQGAESSVLYAIMELAGSGPVLDDVKALGGEPNIFSYGVTQSLSGMNLYKPGAMNGLAVPFSYLNKQVPPPFDKETAGGMGQVIHDKFVVVDFNDKSPVVFTGSSNLAAGGETQNGDNLLAISDQGIVTAYAVEAIRLIDHFHFRAAMQAATNVNPLQLSAGDWWQPYFDEQNIKCRERELFVR